jgi:hypothetical protein
MQVAEEAMKILRDSQPTSEESKCMQDYCEALIEIETMKKELSEFKGQMTNAFRLKKKRVEILSNAVHSFHESYFNMIKYKELNAKANRALLEKEMEFINLVAQATK